MASRTCPNTPIVPTTPTSPRTGRCPLIRREGMWPSRGDSRGRRRRPCPVCQSSRGESRQVVGGTEAWRDSLSCGRRDQNKIASWTKSGDLEISRTSWEREIARSPPTSTNMGRGQGTVNWAETSRRSWQRSASTILDHHHSSPSLLTDTAHTSRPLYHRQDQGHSYNKACRPLVCFPSSPLRSPRSAVVTQPTSRSQAPVAPSSRSSSTCSNERRR